VFFPDMIPPEMASVTRNVANLGFPGNCNAGVPHTTGNIVVLVNQDVYAGDISRGWDTALLAAFEDPTVGIVGPRLLFPDGRVQNAGGLFDSRYQPFHRCLGWLRPDNEQVATPMAVHWTTGAVFAVRRWLWDSLGGFDLAYRGGYFEDVDFCLRAAEVGMKVWYEPRATLIHEVGTTGGNPHFMKNAALFRERWVDSGKINKLTDTHPAVVQGWW